jgi:hypothetical protein
MVKRVVKASELKAILDEMSLTERIQNICKIQKHWGAEWDLNYLKDRLVTALLTLKDDAVFFVYFRDGKPNSIFAGFVSSDWVSGRRGVQEIIWVTCGKSYLDGIKVISAVEEFIQQRSLDFLNCSYISHGGDPRVQMFYMNNGFNVDTLNFVKNYK